VPTALYFYITIAMLIAVSQKAGESAGPTGADPEFPRGRAVLQPAVLVVSAALIFFAVRLLVADCELVKVQTGIAAGKGAEVAERYQRVRNWGLSADIWYSRQMAEAARAALDPVSALRAWQQALEGGFRATRTAEDPHNAWYSLASLHA